MFIQFYSFKCLNSEPSLFSLPPIQTFIESSQWVYDKPVFSVTDVAPLRVCCCCCKVEPLNNLMHSLSNQVDVYFNRKAVSPPGNPYAYPEYIETLINHGPALWSIVALV